MTERLTWTPTDGHGQNLHAMAGDRLIGQVACYDGSTPPWGAFIHGVRVGSKGRRYDSQDAAKAAVERAWGSQRT